MRQILLLILLTGMIFTLSAQGLYIDITAGGGTITTDYDYNTECDDVGFYGGIKVGYGFIESLPLYLVADISFTNSATNESDQIYIPGGYVGYDFSGNHLFFGAGAVYYPHRFIQVAASGGMVLSNTTTDYSMGITGQANPLKGSLSDSGMGFGAKASVALDIGGAKSGWLVGGKFQMLSSAMDDWNVSTMYIGGFVGYRFGKKPVKVEDIYEY